MKTTYEHVISCFHKFFGNSLTKLMSDKPIQTGRSLYIFLKFLIDYEYSVRD